MHKSFGDDDGESDYSMIECVYVNTSAAFSSVSTMSLDPIDPIEGVDETSGLLDRTTWVIFSMWMILESIWNLTKITMKKLKTIF